MFQAVAVVLDRVRSSIGERHHPKGPIVRYAIDQVRLGSHRPWNADGQQLPLVHTAAVSIELRSSTSRTWRAGSPGRQGRRPGIGYVNWDLSEEKRRRSSAQRGKRQFATPRGAPRTTPTRSASGPCNRVSMIPGGCPGAAQGQNGKCRGAPAASPPQIILRPGMSRSAPRWRRSSSSTLLGDRAAPTLDHLTGTVASRINRQVSDAVAKSWVRTARLWRLSWFRGLRSGCATGCRGPRRLRARSVPSSPPAGVTVAALILSRRHQWPAVLAAIVLAETIVDLSAGVVPGATAGYALANSVEPPLEGLSGAGLVQGVSPTGRRRDLFYFVVGACVAGPALGGFLGEWSPGIWERGGREPRCAGSPVTASVLVVAAPIPVAQAVAHSQGRPAETVAAVGSASALSWLSIGTGLSPSLLILPVLALAALRLDGTRRRIGRCRNGIRGQPAGGRRFDHVR